jgi:cell wall-associated NlpC family hydrolase
MWTAQPLAQADPLTDAKDKLATLQGEASQLDEQYNQVQAQLTTAQDQLQQAEAAITEQQGRVASMRDQVAVVTLQQFQDRGITSTARLLTSNDQQEALDRILITSRVTDTTTALLQSYQLGQATLEDLERAKAATVESIKSDQARLEQLKAEASQKIKEAEDLVNRLTEEERARLAAANAAALGAKAKSGKSIPPPPPVQNGAAAQAIVDWAMARVGLPYVYGGAGPNAYDCSGFTMAAFATVGIRLPHSATTQFNYGVPVGAKDLEPGDLVFYYDGPGHVAIYVGAGMVVDARNERIGVVYRPIVDGMPMVGARRLL